MNILLDVLSSSLASELKSYSDEISGILKSTFKDGFVDVKLKSCRCVEAWSTSMPEDFHLAAPCLVAVALTGVTHQQRALRQAYVETLGRGFCSS